MTEFIAYYRVSTDKQGAAGLGMEAALGQEKVRGTKLGNARAVEAAALGRAARIIRKPPPQVLTLIQERRSAGASLREIAQELNQLGIKTPRGCQWYACTVRNQ